MLGRLSTWHRGQLPRIAPSGAPTAAQLSASHVVSVARVLVLPGSDCPVRTPTPHCIPPPRAPAPLPPPPNSWARRRGALGSAPLAASTTRSPSTAAIGTFETKQLVGCGTRSHNTAAVSMWPDTSTALPDGTCGASRRARKRSAPGGWRAARARARGARRARQLRGSAAAAAPQPHARNSVEPRSQSEVKATAIDREQHSLLISRGLRFAVLRHSARELPIALIIPPRAQRRVSQQKLHRSRLKTL